MRYFKCMKTGVDVQRLLDEIQSVANAWDLSTGRQEKISVQREAEGVPIRGLVKSKIGDRKRRDVHESRYTSAARRFPEVCAFFEGFAAQQEASLGRAKLVRLKPGHRVYPHIDRGKYYAIRDRYHLILQSVNGSYLKSGDESVRMREGELWWFDNKQIHEACNDGSEDRIHFIFDLFPNSHVVEALPDSHAA